MASTYLPYVVSEVFIFILTLSILLRVDASLGSKAETKALKCVIYAYLAVLITDIIWAWAENDSIELNPGVLALVNGAYLCAFTAVCFLWYQFTSVRLEFNLGFTIPRPVLMAPFCINIGLVVVSVFTDWIFYIDESGAYLHGKWYYIYLIGSYFYVAISFIRAIGALLQAKTSAKQKECLVCAAYIIPPFIGQLLKPYLPTVPVLHSCLYLILQILFLTLQENQIYIDGLTGLNNRRRLNGYLEEQLPTASDKKPITVFMMDMNDFKSINDTFGHVEGDRALIIMARALKKAAGEFNSFVARYGGDEFCMVCIGRQYDQNAIITRITELLEQTRSQTEQSYEKGYTLSVSIGFAVCNEPQYDMDRIIKLADERLHKEKRVYKSRG